MSRSMQGWHSGAITLADTVLPGCAAQPPMGGERNGDGGEALSATGDRRPDLATKRRRILLMEDEPLVALELEFAMADAGLHVLGPFGRLDQGLAFLNGPARIDGRIDGAILDIDLNGQDVFPVAEILHQRAIPFLFHTGHGRREELGERFEGALVCPKPMLAEDLIRRLIALL